MPPDSEPSSRLHLTASAALSWLLVAALSVGLSLAIADSALREDLLPWRLRLSTTAAELSALAAWVALVAMLIAMISSLRFLPALLRAPTAVALTGIVVGLYSASWLAFASAGRFLDWSGLLFAAVNPVLFLQHVAHIDPYVLAIVPFVLIVGIASFCLWIPALVGRVQPPGRRALVLAAVVAAVTCLGLASLGPGKGFPAEAIVVDPDAGFNYTHAQLYERCREERSGPLTHAWDDFASRWLEEGPGLITDDSIAIERRPIVDLDDYAAGVDKGRLRSLNVILLVVESLRPDQLTTLGGSRQVMPAIDSLAARSLAFSDVYTQSSHSNYADICPLSSHYPLRSAGVHVYPRNPSYPRVLVYDILQELGWRTAMISSQNETWGRMIDYLDTGGLDYIFHAETFEGPTYVPRHDWGFESFVNAGKRSGKIDDRFTIDEAIRWIGDGSDEQPFFVYLNMQNSHLPYETPADFPRRFGPSTLPFKIRFSGYPRDQADTVKDVYADSLAYIDHQLSRLLGHLEESGLLEETVIVVTSDTGQAFYEHGFVAHGSRMFNEVMRVPLFFHEPGGAPVIDERPAQHIDVPPTLLGILGLPPHPAFQGRDLRNAEGEWRWRSRYLVAQTPLAHEYAIVRNGFKLLYDAERDSSLLFNVDEDPGERVDLAATYGGLVEELRSRLDTWRDAQIGYYRDIALHSRYYPPVLAD